MLAFRHRDLVYLPFTKHASTSYSALFSKLGWEETDSHFVNWDNNVVFAHIIDPNSRHLKGIAECLQQYNLVSLLEHPNFDKLLSTAVFDLHSYPLYASFGGNWDRMKKAHWIPLDHPEYSGSQLTVDFLSTRGINITTHDIPVLNSSSHNDKLLVNRIKSVRDKNQLKGILNYFYGKDIELYSEVILRNYTELTGK